jgi:hypothetical protein
MTALMKAAYSAAVVALVLHYEGHKLPQDLLACYLALKISSGVQCSSKNQQITGQFGEQLHNKKKNFVRNKTKEDLQQVLGAPEQYPYAGLCWVFSLFRGVVERYIRT